jgi:hypothetical protein
MIHVDGIGILGPGLETWPIAAGILRGDQPLVAQPVRLPPPELLPPTERRRAGAAIKLSMTTGLEAIRHAGVDPATLANVFSSTGGDCENCHNMLETLASSDRMVSPTRFHNSVHNAPAGYWSIATHSTAPSTSLAAFDATFGAGLVEAAAQVMTSGAPCLLVAFDTTYPEPLHTLRPIPSPFGVGMVLSPRRSAATLATLRIALTQASADTLDHPELEQMRLNIPAARSLPLLQRLANGSTGCVVIEYLEGCNLAIEVVE